MEWSDRSNGGKVCMSSLSYNLLKHVDNNYNVDPVSALLWLELTQAALA